MLLPNCFHGPTVWKHKVGHTQKDESTQGVAGAPEGIRTPDPRFVVSCSAADQAQQNFLGVPWGVWRSYLVTVVRKSPFTSMCLEDLQLYQVTSKLHRGFLESSFLGMKGCRGPMGYMKITLGFSRAI